MPKHKWVKFIPAYKHDYQDLSKEFKKEGIPTKYIRVRGPAMGPPGYLAIPQKYFDDAVDTVKRLEAEGIIELA